MTGWPKRFSAKVRSGGPDECWLWLASKLPSGYGFFGWRGRVRLAHRVAWELDTGQEPPPWLCVCHRCDNPACVNPAHLFLGTKADNAADRDAKGRQARQRGETNGKAKLTEAQVLAIRAAPGLLREIASDFGVTQQVISQIKRREIWRHLDAPGGAAAA